MNPHHEVVIVGGGLAGMTAAFRLLEQGYQVSLYEASSRLGGKVGSAVENEYSEDHGFHLFPAWYSNFWKVFKDIGCERDGNFKEINDFYQVYKNTNTYRRMAFGGPIVKTMIANLFSGIMSLPDTILFGAVWLDLMLARGRSHIDPSKFALDNISIFGFINSLYYTNAKQAAEFQELLLKGTSAPIDFMSAATVQHVIRAWAMNFRPLYFIPTGSLQETIIDPFEKVLRDRGCKIFKGYHLKKNSCRCEQPDYTDRFHDVQRSYAGTSQPGSHNNGAVGARKSILPGYGFCIHSGGYGTPCHSTRSHDSPAR